LQVRTRNKSANPGDEKFRSAVFTAENGTCSRAFSSALLKTYSWTVPSNVFVAIALLLLLLFSEFQQFLTAIVYAPV
jgi:hypothetical protein